MTSSNSDPGCGPNRNGCFPNTEPTPFRDKFASPVYDNHTENQRERLCGPFLFARFISMRPRRLITVRMGVLFHRTVSRLSRITVGMARRTRSDRERATATCEAGTPRIVTSTFVAGPLTPHKTPTFPTDDSPKHQHWQLSGSSELAMQPQPFLHSASHSPAPHFAIVHPRKWSSNIVPTSPFFVLPVFSLLSSNQAQ
jgi:hypothetical protein